jgi:hypothetical protein
VTDPTTEALRRFRERVECFVEHAQQDYVSDTGEWTEDWAAVINLEAGILVRRGGADYLRYLAEVERRAAEGRRIAAEAADQADIDRRFHSIIGGQP